MRIEVRRLSVPVPVPVLLAVSYVKPCGHGDPSVTRTIGDELRPGKYSPEELAEAESNCLDSTVNLR